MTTKFELAVHLRSFGIQNGDFTAASMIYHVDKTIGGHFEKPLRSILCHNHLYGNQSEKRIFNFQLCDYTNVQ